MPHPSPILADCARTLHFLHCGKYDMLHNQALLVLDFLLFFALSVAIPFQSTVPLGPGLLLLIRRPLGQIIQGHRAWCHPEKQKEYRQGASNDA